MTIYDPIEDKILAAGRDKREKLLDRMMVAGMYGNEVLAHREAYQPLSPEVKLRIKATMRRWFPWDGDPSPEEQLPLGFRQLLETTLTAARSRFASPRRSVGAGGTSFNRPDVYVPDHRRQHGQGPVYFDASNGVPCGPDFPPSLPERLRPPVVELPGEFWPPDLWDFDLNRVRWSRGRPTVWLRPDDEEPE
jgi:hypothetical protein